MQENSFRENRFANYLYKERIRFKKTPELSGERKRNLGYLKMKIENHLVFEAHKSLYAIASTYVVELIWLPELNYIESSFFYIIGMQALKGSQR